MQARTIHYIPPVAQLAVMLRVAAYCRVSSDSEDQLESYAAQVEHYDRLIRQNPRWELVDIYADEGLTGTRADTRGDFQRLVKDCRRGKIDKVLVKSISRFARNTRDCLTSIRELKALGVEVFFEKEKIDTGDMSSELMLSFYASAAQEESLSISGNMRWSYQHRMKSGMFITCRAPYGYQLIKGTLVIDSDEAPIVRRIFSEYLSGMGAEKIAERLAAEGTPKVGGLWTDKSIRFILKNEKYAGNILLQKRYKSDGLPFQEIWNKGERDMYYVENSHPAIISQETFDRTQALMAQRNVETTAGKYPFSLMVFCDKCGASFKRRVTGGKAYWVCRTHDGDKDDCPVGRIPEPALEQAFIRLHHKLRAHRHDILSPMAEQLFTLRQRAALQQTRVAEIDREIIDIGRQAMILHRLHGAGHMDAALYYAHSAGFNGQVNALRRERLRLLEPGEDDAPEQTTLLLDIMKNSPERLNAFDAELFRSMVRRITIGGPEQVRFALINSLEVTERL